jgi:UDP-glucose 4-epimerase
MKCLVTGGAGFVGSHIVDALVNHGHEVTILDNLSTGKRENISHHGSKVNFIQADLRDMDALQFACQNAEIIFHKAAIASVSQSINDPQSTYEVNVVGTGNLFEAAGKAGVKHLIFASSAAVYGQVPHPICDESLTPQPASQYGLSKLVGEHYGRFYSEFYNMQVTCLRYFNIYGTRQSSDSDYAGVISLFIHMLLSGNNPRIFGDGHQTRDFINVADIVQANLKAMERTNAYTFEVLNIGTSRQSSVLELLSCLETIVGKSFQPEYKSERRGELRHSLSDIQKAKKILGFEPNVSFYKGLQELVNYTRARSQDKLNSLQTGEPFETEQKACNA